MRKHPIPYILIIPTTFTACLLVCLNYRVSKQSSVLILDMCKGGCGMGNQMFIYASGLGIALDNPQTPMCISGFESTENTVHPRSIMGFYVDIAVNASVIKPFEACTWQTSGDAGYLWWRSLGYGIPRFLGMIDVFQPPHTVYEPFVLKGDKTTVIDGNLESYKYFQNVPHPIFKLRQYEAARRWMQRRGLTSAVHVRRGDKLLEGFPVAPVSFYEGAFRRLGHNRVAICTDDASWVLGQRIFQNASVSINHSPGFDMALLAAATDSVVIGIGTFGWWGAYLSKAKRKIFYPIQFQGGWADGYKEADFIPYGIAGQGEWLALMH